MHVSGLMLSPRTTCGRWNGKQKVIYTLNARITTNYCIRAIFDKYPENQTFMTTIANRLKPMVKKNQSLL